MRYSSKQQPHSTNLSTAFISGTDYCAEVPLWLSLLVFDIVSPYHVWYKVFTIRWLLSNLCRLLHFVSFFHILPCHVGPVVCLVFCLRYQKSSFYLLIILLVSQERIKGQTDEFYCFSNKLAFRMLAFSRLSLTELCKTQLKIWRMASRELDSFSKPFIFISRVHYNMKFIPMTNLDASFLLPRRLYYTCVNVSKRLTLCSPAGDLISSRSLCFRRMFTVVVAHSKQSYFLSFLSSESLWLLFVGKMSPPSTIHLQPSKM